MSNEIQKEWKTVATSQWIDDMCNPIREIVEKIKMPGPGQKKMIPLSIGDPTVFGNLRMAKTFRAAKLQLSLDQIQSKTHRKS